MGHSLKMDHILHRTYLSKPKGTEISPCMLSDHYAMKLKVNDKRNCKNSINMEITLLNNHWVTDEFKEEIRQYL